jgi:hypothetical protein
MELLNQRWIVALMARLLRTWVRIKRLVLSSPSPAADDDGSSSPEQMVQHMFEGLLAEDPHDTEHLQFRHFQRVLPGFDQSSFDAVLRLTDSDPELGVSLDALLTIYLELELSDLRADYASYLRTDVEDVPALELETEAALEDPWSIDYDALGWHPRLPCHYNDPDVGALREQLRAHGGCGMIADQTGHVEPIEIVDPVVPGYGARAAELLRRDGYVVIKDVLDEQRLQTVRQGVERVVRQIVARDPDRLGNRGSHRYTFGPACEAFGEHAAWAPLVDPPALMEVLRHIFGEEGVCLLTSFVCSRMLLLLARCQDRLRTTANIVKCRAFGSVQNRVPLRRLRRRRFLSARSARIPAPSLGRGRAAGR